MKQKCLLGTYSHLKYSKIPPSFEVRGTWACTFFDNSDFSLIGLEQTKVFPDSVEPGHEAPLHLQLGSRKLKQTYLLYFVLIT